MFLRTYFDNTLTAFIPQFWVNEGVAILEENMVIANQVHRDFEPILAQYGDVVNTRKPHEFQAKRKEVADSVTIQDAAADNIQVKLDQMFHVSFMIRDGEESKSFKNLIQEFIRPALIPMARAVDQLLLGQHWRFWDNYAGALNKFTGAAAKNYILDARQTLNTNKAYVDGRNLILTPSSETELLKLDTFTEAQKVGDNGTALRNASLGHKLGFEMFMSQNASGIATPNIVGVNAVNNGAGYKRGDNAITYDGSGTLSAGQWVVIDGDDTPQQVLSAASNILTVVGSLKRPIADNAVITSFTGNGQVNHASGYSAGWSKEIAIDTVTQPLAVGQSLTFGPSGRDIYTVIQYNGSGATANILLDRPLVNDIADDAKAWGCPTGQYNFAFHRNALAFVNRPLAMPQGGVGAVSAVAHLNGISLRVVITYNGEKQGHLVTFDMLAGVALLDKNLGCVIFG